MKVFDEGGINGEKFAIIVNETTKEAFEAIWNGQDWETDFSYFTLKTTAGEVAELLDFAGARKAGYRFPEDALGKS